MPMYACQLWSKYTLARMKRQTKIFLGGKMFDFWRITLFCSEKRLSKHKITIFSKNFRGTMPYPGYAYVKRLRDAYNNAYRFMHYIPRNVTVRPHQVSYRVTRAGPSRCGA